MPLSGLCHRPLLVLLCLYLGFPLLSARGQDQVPAPGRKEKQFERITADPYQKWLNEDTLWIITDQERADFSRLATDQQRDAFIVAFWNRRNPTPQSAENPYKEEHYRRIAYANTRFAASAPGYRTDRGRFYIIFGPPDSVDSKAAFAPPSERWHYLFVEGIGRNVTLTFTDKCFCGKYELSGADSDPRVPKIFDPLKY